MTNKIINIPNFLEKILNTEEVMKIAEKLRLARAKVEDLEIELNKVQATFRTFKKQSIFLGVILRLQSY
jgi:hypothetical protein